MKYKKNIINIICIISLITISIHLFSTSYAFEEFVWTANTIQTTDTLSEELITKKHDEDLNLESESAILIDQESGKILYEHNSHEKLRPASVTKVMSILLIMEALDSGQITLQDKVPCSEKASSMGGSQVWLTTSETLTVDDMLKCICIVSANDCTVAMAEYLCGSTEAFVERMNQKAKELGMNDTCFKNCHGIDEEGHVSSSYDIAIMSRELLNNHPNITKYTTTWMDTIRDGKSELVNTNKLIRNYEGCTGLKTGSTSLALYNISSSATRDGLSLIAVIMKAPTTTLRFSEAKKLLDYGFSKYSTVKLSTKDEIIKEVSIEKGTNQSINAIFQDDKNRIILKEQESLVSQEIEIPDKLQAPINKGDVIGKIKYLINGEIIATVDVVADKDVKKMSFLNISGVVLKKWFNLLR